MCEGKVCEGERGKGRGGLEKVAVQARFSVLKLHWNMCAYDRNIYGWNGVVT